MTSDNKAIEFILIKERPILGYALFYAIGCYLVFVFTINIFTVSILADIMLVAIIVQTLRLKKARCFILLFFLFAGYCLCSESIPSWYVNPTTPPEKAHITGEVIEVHDYGTYARYTLDNVAIDDVDMGSKVILTNVAPKNKVNTGDRIITSAELELPAVSPLAGLWDERRYYMSKDIQYTVTVFEKKIGIISSNPSQNIHQKINKQIYNNLNDNLDGNSLGLAFGLSTGDKSYLDDVFYDKCCDLGIAHVFAVSGLHLGILLSILLLISMKLRIRYLFRCLLSIAVVIIIMLIIGARVSLLRAGIMAFIVLLYNVKGLRKDALTILSICVLILLTINPLYIIDAGFILSVSSVMAISVVIQPLSTKYKDKKIITFYPIAIFITSLGISVFNFLLLIRYFGQVSLLSPIWNIIFIPLITVLIVLLFFYYCTFYIPFIGIGIIKIIDFIADIMVKLVNFVDKINITISINTPSLFAVIAFMVIIFFMSNFIVKNRQKVRIIVGICLITLLISFTATDKDKNSITAMTGYDDVFVLIETDDEYALIINTLDKGIHYSLEQMNITSIDKLIFTGNDYEEFTRLNDSMNGIEITEIYLSQDLYNEYPSSKYTAITDTIYIDNVSIDVAEFKANKNAVVNYYAIITTPNNSFAYLDTYKLREGAIDDSHILICSKWSKARIKNIPYIDTKYVIINSNNYCMDLYSDSAKKNSITIHNINNSGAVIYPIEDK